MDKQHFDPRTGHDRSAELLEQVRQALAEKTALAIRGGSSKAFLGRWVEARPLDVAGHTGIVSYDPTELVITARAGTPLRELNAALDSAGQMLACEAPCFTENATVGGMLAAGLSGPRRPWAGAVRDFVLGTRLISGLGTHLRFGGEVMKNVAGYDLSRLLAGSFGCLGVITEASFKVLPKPRCRISLRQAIPLERALLRLVRRYDGLGHASSLGISLLNEPGATRLPPHAAPAVVRPPRMGSMRPTSAGPFPCSTAPRPDAAGSAGP